MSIAKTMKYLTAHDIHELYLKAGGPKVHYPQAHGDEALITIRNAFIDALPDDDSDIYAWAKNRNDQRWGVDLDSVLPYTRMSYVLAFHLHTLPVGHVDENVSALVLLTAKLHDHVQIVVTGLVSKAIEIYEEQPDAPEFVAIVNVPGYVPDDAPQGFETPQEAWQYLADDRKYICAENDRDHLSDRAWQVMNGYALNPNAQIESVLTDNPAYSGDHGLGLAYTVTQAEITEDDE